MSTPRSVPAPDRASNAVRPAPGRRQGGGERFGAALSAELEQGDQQRPVRAASRPHNAASARDDRDRHSRSAPAERSPDRVTGSGADRSKPARRRAAAEDDSAPGATDQNTPGGTADQPGGGGIMAAGVQANATPASGAGVANSTDQTGTPVGQPAVSPARQTAGTPQANPTTVPGDPASLVDHGVVPAEADISPAEAHDRGSGATSPAAAPDQPTSAAEDQAGNAQGQLLNPAAGRDQASDPAAPAGTGHGGPSSGATGPGQAGPGSAATGPGPANAATGPGQAGPSSPGQAGPSSTATGPGQAGPAGTATGPGPASPGQAGTAGTAGTAAGPGRGAAGKPSAAAGPGQADRSGTAGDPALGRAGHSGAAAGAAKGGPKGTGPAASDAPRTASDGTVDGTKELLPPTATADAPVVRDAVPGVPGHVLAGVAGPAPTAAPATAAPSAGPPAAPPAAQVAMQIVPLRLEADGVHRLTVHLHPADLGPVQVVAEIRNGDVAVQLSGSTDAGSAALRDSLDDLRRELTASGFANCSLDLRDGGEQARQQYSAPRPGGGPQGTTIAPIVTPEPAPQRPAPTGRLDVRA